MYISSYLNRIYILILRKYFFVLYHYHVQDLHIFVNRKNSYGIFVASLPKSCYSLS